MSHPLSILQTLDRHLTQPTRLILYGRAALALGFFPPCQEFNATFDVDAILPGVDMAAIESDHQFWDAIEATNAELHPTGLYITHLFSDAQVILTPHYLQHLVPITCCDFQYLKAFRPSTGDLILTKMMRIDPQDREDLTFLLKHFPDGPASLLSLFDHAVLPDVPEIKEAFQANRTWLMNGPSSSTSETPPPP